MKIAYETTSQRSSIITDQTAKGQFLVQDSIVLVKKVVEPAVFGKDKEGNDVLISEEKQDFVKEYFLEFASEPLVYHDPKPTLEDRVNAIEVKLNMK